VIALLLPGNESKSIDAEPRDAAIAHRNLAALAGPTFTASPTHPRFQTIWGGVVFMMIVVAVGMYGLASFSLHVANQAQELDLADRPGAGITVRSEIIRLWLPKTVIDLAKSQSSSRTVRTHDELQRFLELRDQKAMWYAQTTRGYQVDGNAVDITLIRRPYDEPQNFPELLEVLSITAGNQPLSLNAAFSKAPVHVIDPELSKREPREVMTQLLRQRSPTPDDELRP
jgi:hypothetical protein